MQNQISTHILRDLLLKIQSQEVKQAQQKLKELSTNKLFFQLMYRILNNAEQQEWVKSIAASVLNHLFTQKINSDNIQPIFEAIQQIILAPQIKQIDKRIFEKTIIRFVQQGYQVFQEKILWLVSECLKNIYYYDSAYLIIACIAVSDIPLDLIEGVIKNTYEPILASVEVTVENANLLNQMFKMWIVIIDKLLLQKTMRPLLEKMISSEYLFGLINSIYMLHSTENTLLCCQQGLYELNFLKYQAAELNKRMLSIQTERAGEGFPKILQFTKINLLKIAGTLNKLAQQRNKIQQINGQDLTSTLFSIIRLYLNIKPQQFKFQDIITIQNHIIFPFIAIDDLEIHRFQQSPQDFNSLAQDCCDKQTFGIIKTQACKLLQSIGDKSQLSLKYAVNRAIQSIKIKIGLISHSHINLNLTDLSIETSFLILSIFSYGISNYPEQLNNIRIILKEERLKALPPIQLSRIFTFLAYNYSQIYKNPNQGQQWLNLAINYQAHPTTSYCAYDCFSNIVQQYFNQMFLDKLTDQISIGKIGLVWQIISKILQKHFTNISNQGLTIIINKLFTRLNKEILLIKNKQKSDSLDIINCLRTFTNLIKEIKKQQLNNIAARKDYLLREIWPILNYYQNCKLLDIEDQIVKVAIEIVKTMDCIDPQIYPHLQEYITSFATGNYSEKIYLKFFNQFMFKADFTRDMGELMNIFVVLKDTLLHCLAKLSEKSKKIKPIHTYRLLLCNVLVIIQNALAIYGTHLLNCNSRQFFDQISSMCIRLIPNQNQPVQKTPSGYIVLARSLNTLFLCHMHIKIELIYPLIKRLSKENLYHGYDTKVFTMCLVKQIFKETDTTAIISLLQSLASIVQNSSIKDDLLHKNKMKKSSPVKLANQLKKIDQFDKLALTIDSPFKNDKEIPFLISDMFNQIKKNNLEAFTSLLINLPKNTISSYQRFINFDKLQKKQRIIRKVIGVKLTPAFQNEIQTEQQPKIRQQMNDSDEEDSDRAFKRQRVKVKVDNKNKLIKTERKRHHNDIEQ